MVEGRRRVVGGEKTPLHRLAVATGFGATLLGAALKLPLATATTTTSSSNATSSGDNGMTDTYYGYGDSVCRDVAVLCAANVFCVECSAPLLELLIGGGDDDGDSSEDDDDSAATVTDDEASSGLCSTRYPSLVSGDDVSFCGRVGTAKCCEYSNNDIASACLDDPLVAEVW